MRRSLIVILSVAMMIAVFALAGFAQDKGDKKMPSQEDMQKMMAEYAKYANPGPEHELLSHMAGEWTTTGKMWMGPGAPSMDLQPGTQTGEMLLGGRYLRQLHHGTMMGQPYEGISMMGYDKFKKQYVLTYSDNMGTAILTAAGTASDDKKTITLMGKMDEPTTGEKDKDVKYVYRFPDDKTIVFEMWDMLPGSPFKAMEMTYTKK
jgi:hypothetical protein